jgi:hypothetical protein
VQENRSSGMKLIFFCLFRGRGSLRWIGKGRLEVQFPPISFYGEGGNREEILLYDENK